MKLLTMTAPKVVLLTTFSAANDENFVKMTIFLFLCIWMEPTLARLNAFSLSRNCYDGNHHNLVDSLSPGHMHSKCKSELGWLASSKQQATTTNDDLSIGHPGIFCDEILSEIQNIFIQENASENVICDIATNLFRSCCGNKIKGVSRGTANENWFKRVLINNLLI